MIRQGIAKIVDGKDLSKEEGEKIMNEIMEGNATSAQIAAFLTALRIKGESVDEITSLASVMRKFCYQIQPKVNDTLVDTCGTGGDKIKTFNISTAAALVAAGAGIPIAKHGNRSVTSRCGSADVLEALGFDLKMNPKMVEKVDRRDRYRFHVRSSLPSSHEVCHWSKERNSNKNHLQSFRPSN